MKEETKRKLMKVAKLAGSGLLLGGAAYAGYKNRDAIKEFGQDTFDKAKNAINSLRGNNQQPQQPQQQTTTNNDKSTTDKALTIVQAGIEKTKEIAKNIADEGERLYGNSMRAVTDEKGNHSPVKALDHFGVELPPEDERNHHEQVVNALKQLPGEIKKRVEQGNKFYQQQQAQAPYNQ